MPINPLLRILSNNTGRSVAKKLTKPAIKKAKKFASESFKKNSGRLIGGMPGSMVDPNAYYTSDYKSEVHPENSKTGTCDYCLRCNGRIFRGADLILPDGELGHHPNCCCAFYQVSDEESPINKGVRNNTPGKTSTFGARKYLTVKSMNSIPAATLQVLANKRGLASYGNKNTIINRIARRK